MSQKITSRFFNVRRRNGDFQLSLRGRQVATIFFDAPTGTYWAACANHNKSAYDFKTFQEADSWAWGNYA